jgi:hypothetical protein
MLYLVQLGDRSIQPSEIFDHYHDDHKKNVDAWFKRIEK